MFLCFMPHKALMLQIFSQARPWLSLFVSVRSVSLTNLLWLLSPLFLCLRALLLSAQGTTECPCQESGTLSYRQAGSSHFGQHVNQPSCASVLLAFLSKRCINGTILYGSANTSVTFCTFCVVYVLTSAILSIHLLTMPSEPCEVTSFWGVPP